MNWSLKYLDTYYSNSRKKKLITLSNKDLVFLKNKSKTSNRNRSRICTHANINQSVQEMFIFHKKNTYVRPHKHLKNKESFQVLYGSVDVVLFNKNGKVVEVINVSDQKSNKVFYYKLSNDIFHTQIFKKDTVFFEVTKGPFNKQHTVFANWAPIEKNKSEVKEYIKTLKKNIRKFNFSYKN
tara:strand:+ start:49 stop:594 length:546 start_codon:yes stop_codon:yes gene_type:complete